MALPEKQSRRLKSRVREIPVEDLDQVVGGTPNLLNNPLLIMNLAALQNLANNALNNLNRVFSREK